MNLCEVSSDICNKLEVSALEAEELAREQERQRTNPKNWSPLRQQWEAFKAIRNLTSGPHEEIPEAFVRSAIAQQYGILPEEVTSEQIRFEMAELVREYGAIRIVPTRQNTDPKTDGEDIPDNTSSELRGLGLTIDINEASAEAIKAELLIISGKLSQGHYHRGHDPQAGWIWDQFYDAYHAIAKQVVTADTPDEVLETVIPNIVEAFRAKEKWMPYAPEAIRQRLSGPIQEWKGKRLQMVTARSKNTPRLTKAPAHETVTDDVAARSCTRSSEVDDFLRRCNDSSPTRIRRNHIWKSVGHSKGRQFEYWQSCNEKATGEDDLNFNRIIRMKPEDFVEILRKKGLIGTPP
jgi:hypothetical protein